jgi:glutathione S-transferase
MSDIDFNDSTLMISARSPFARRVRVAFIEHGIRFEEIVYDVFKANPELNALNPLGRVPALKLKNGSVLIDSSLILQAFHENHPQSLESYRRSAIALGMCEKAVEYFLETLRPKGQQDAELFDEIRLAMERSLEALNDAISRDDSLPGGGITQGDLDVCVALAYLSLRYPTEWRNRYPALRVYFEKIDRRESFARTCPPA